MKYRKIPVVIEAVQWDEKHSTLKAIGAVKMSCDGHKNNPDLCANLRIKTLEGVMHVSPGDWIIKGVKGEFYPCKPDIFELTYEPVEQGNNMTQKPTPEVRKAHAPDDMLERRKKIDKALNDIIHAGYEEADSSRACESGAQSFDGIWWVQKFGCDSLQSCMDECEAVLFEVRIATNLLARINELEQILNNERTVGRQKMKDELASDLEIHLPVEYNWSIGDYIRNWKPRGNDMTNIQTQVETFKRKLLEDALEKCTTNQRCFFKTRLYPNGVSDNQINDAYNLCQRTIASNKEKHESET